MSPRISDLARNTIFLDSQHDQRYTPWMPPLQTKTFRIRKDQDEELSLKYKDKSSSLIRELLDIFSRSQIPGAEIMKLRKRMQEGENNGMSGV